MVEGIVFDDIIEIVENIVYEYKEKGYFNEWFYKFFKCVKNVYGFDY